MEERQLFYSHALREALVEEMERDERVVLLGEDIGVWGGAFKVTEGLLERFGPRRVIDTPIAENTLVGLATGMALLGLRPVVEVMFMDFIALAMDQILNHATKIFYMYGGQASVPWVLRTPAGGGRGYGPTHSQSLEAWFLRVPGLKIATPATPYDAKGLLKTAIRDPNPVLFVEHKLLYPTQGPVPEGEYLIPFGRARIAREGEDVTVVAYSRMVLEAEAAAEMLAQEGISVEVVDLRTLCPLDTDTVAASAAKTGRVVLVEEGVRTGGVSAEVGFRLFEQVFDYLDAPLLRVCGEDVPIPCCPTLENAVLPHRYAIAAAVRRLVR